MSGPGTGRTEVILACDVGTTSTKAVIMRADGRVVGRGSGRVEVVRPQPGWVEQQPFDWWQSLSRAIIEAGTSSDVSLADVTALTFTSQMLE